MRRIIRKVVMCDVPGVNPGTQVDKGPPVGKFVSLLSRSSKELKAGNDDEAFLILGKLLEFFNRTILKQNKAPKSIQTYTNKFCDPINKIRNLILIKKAIILANLFTKEELAKVSPNDNLSFALTKLSITFSDQKTVLEKAQEVKEALESGNNLDSFFADREALEKEAGTVTKANVNLKEGLVPGLSNTASSIFTLLTHFDRNKYNNQTLDEWVSEIRTEIQKREQAPKKETYKRDDYLLARKSSVVPSSTPLPQTGSPITAKDPATPIVVTPPLLASNVFSITVESERINTFSEIKLLIVEKDEELKAFTKEFVLVPDEAKLGESTCLELAKELFTVGDLKQKWPLIAVALAYSQSNGKNKIPDLDELHTRTNNLLESCWSPISKDELLKTYEYMNEHDYGSLVTDTNSGFQSDKEDLIKQAFEKTMHFPTMSYEDFVDAVHKELTDFGKYELEQRIKNNLNLSNLEYHVYRAYREITGKKSIPVTAEDLKKKLQEEQHGLKDLDIAQITKAVSVFNIRFNNPIQLSKEKDDTSNVIITYPDFQDLGFTGHALPDIKDLAEAISRIYIQEDKERFMESFNVLRNGVVRIHIAPEKSDSPESAIDLIVKVIELNNILRNLNGNIVTNK